MKKAHVMEVRVISLAVPIELSVCIRLQPAERSFGGVWVSCLETGYCIQIFPWQLVQAVGSGDFFQVEIK